MRYRLTLLFSFFLLLGVVNAQEKKSITYADFAFAGGSYRGTATLSYAYEWQTGKKQKFGIGLGARFTTFLGANLYYITAPGKITSGSSSPLIIFKENIAENIDSLLVKSPQVNAINAMVNINYRLSEKVIVGFDIDLIGFSFGGHKQANYINGVEGKNTEASPTPFNILLISDNDHGTLNSEFYARYSISEKLSLKISAQFLFTEYTTREAVQQFPEENNRFRNKSLLAALGISYKL